MAKLGPNNITTSDGGPVLAAERPHRFVFQRHPDSSEYLTTVGVVFEHEPRGTIVQLREHGYADTPAGGEACVTCATGWGETLTLPKFYVEHGLRS